MSQRKKYFWPQSIPEVVEQLLTELSPEITEGIAHLTEDALVNLHFGLGHYTHNQYGLWEGNDALLTACAAAKAGAEQGDIYLLIDSDAASAVILHALWEHVRA
jgi:hypothetical protein